MVVKNAKAKATNKAENGTTPKVENSSKLQKVEDEKKPQEAKGTASTVTVVGRIENLSKMQRLADRHRHLKLKDEKLETFIQGSDGSKDLLELSNDKGQVFEVANSDVIKEVVRLLRAQLDDRLKETEKEILTFSV